jgi:arsenate reductase
MPDKVVLYHNTKCGTSRYAFEMLTEKGLDFEIVEYLKTPLNEHEIKSLLKKLKIKAEDLVRKRESIYKDNYKEKFYSEKEWINILKENPKLIERPIIEYKDKAIIGRPKTEIVDFIKEM